MDINEAYQKLKVTEEVVKSLRNYFDFEHTSINLLSNLDPQIYCELSRSGWILAKDREDLQQKIKIFSESDLFRVKQMIFKLLNFVLFKPIMKCSIFTILIILLLMMILLLQKKLWLPLRAHLNISKLSVWVRLSKNGKIER